MVDIIIHNGRHTTTVSSVTWYAKGTYRFQFLYREVILTISAELVGMRKNEEPTFLPRQSDGNFVVLGISASS